jgi:AraC family transcriptional regulator
LSVQEQVNHSFNNLPDGCIHIETSAGEVLYDTDVAREEKIVTEQCALLVNLCYDESLTAINSDKFINLITPKDCVVFIPSGTEITEISDGSGEMVMIEIEDQSIRQFSEHHSVSPAAFAHYRYDIECQYAGNIARQIRNQMLRAKHLDNLVIEELSLELKEHTMLKLGQASYSNHELRPSIKDSKLKPSTLRKVYDYVEANLHGKISLDKLSGVAALSPFYFNRAFKNTTGQSPHQMVLDRRIRKARLSLTNSKQSISEIALDSGFSSQTHLSDWFKKALGTTPAKYRQINSGRLL